MAAVALALAAVLARSVAQMRPVFKEAQVVSARAHRSAARLAALLLLQIFLSARAWADLARSVVPQLARAFLFARAQALTLALARSVDLALLDQTFHFVSRQPHSNINFRIS